LADCLETNGNLIEKGSNQNSIKITNNFNINEDHQVAAGQLLNDSTVSHRNQNSSG